MPNSSKKSDNDNVRNDGAQINSNFGKYKKWFFGLLLVLLFSGVLGYGFLLDFVDRIKRTADIEEVEEPTKTDSITSFDEHDKIDYFPSLQASEYIDIAETASSDYADEAEIAEEIPAEEVEKVAAKEEAEIIESPAVQIVTPVVASNPQLEAKIAALENAQKAMVLYIAAGDFLDSVNRGAVDEDSLLLLNRAAAYYPQITGKIDILRLAAEGGIPSYKSLASELDTLAAELEKSQDKSVIQSIKESLGGLVKVTKIKADNAEEIDGNKIYAVKKIAELALQEKDLERAISFVSSYGDAADEWLKQAKNLERVVEITDYIIGFAQKRIIAKPVPETHGALSR
ncbi:MAG: hypothetical protein COV36_07795 [Alphaproteobacteria bacterium CG11_big_fil_rev_8_21_14_0_20_44_7]|nr:MAG: hypothetical protein COV36_07795 [Alphaproteobacteria bacterium CG11_big_fil_rev_8_21_14_0_20_44_7]